MDLGGFDFAVPFEHSFDATLGLRYDHVRPDEVVASFEARPELLDRNGVVGLGVFTAVAEGTASMGTAFAVMPKGARTLSGLSNDTTLTGDVQEGLVTARATRRANTAETWTWDVECRDAQERVCSISKVLIAVPPLR